MAGGIGGFEDGTPGERDGAMTILQVFLQAFLRKMRNPHDARHMCDIFWTKTPVAA